MKRGERLCVVRRKGRGEVPGEEEEEEKEEEEEEEEEKGEEPTEMT